MYVHIQVRHAQGVHNLESEKSRDPLTSFEYFDAELSSQGWQQVIDSLRLESFIICIIFLCRLPEECCNEDIVKYSGSPIYTSLKQVCDQRRYVCASGLLEKIEVVITSPMTRYPSFPHISVSPLVNMT